MKDWTEIYREYMEDLKTRAANSYHANAQQDAINKLVLERMAQIEAKLQEAKQEPPKPLRHLTVDDIRRAWANMPLPLDSPEEMAYKNRIKAMRDLFSDHTPKYDYMESRIQEYKKNYGLWTEEIFGANFIHGQESPLYQARVHGWSGPKPRVHVLGNKSYYEHLFEKEGVTDDSVDRACKHALAKVIYSINRANDNPRLVRGPHISHWSYGARIVEPNQAVYINPTA